MVTQEQKFFDGFMLLLGVWIGTIAGIVLFADLAVNGETTQEADETSSSLEERIQPIGQVALLGDPDIGIVATVSVASETVRAPLSGPQVYNDICYLCHAAPGVGGAPVHGDVAAWAPRLEQSDDVLQEHVLNGYQGAAGYMPPKGGRLDLTDEEIVAAIEFMLEAVQQ